MESKSELLTRIVGELLASQRADQAPTPLKPQFPFDMPPQLPAGDGQWLPFSKAGLSDVEAFAEVLIANDVRLTSSFSRSEVIAIVARAFGVSFASVDIDADRNEIEARVNEDVRAELVAAFDVATTMHELALGCWALTGIGTQDLSIGPIRITERNLWLDRMVASNRVDRVTSRRVKAAWHGKTLRPRSPSMNHSWEEGILDSVGDCDTVCAVSTAGLGPKVAEQKGLLAARLGLMALALFWRTPSQALGRMGLLYDGPRYRRHWISFSQSAPIGSSSQLSGMKGHFTTDEWLNNWKNGEWLRSPIGEALTAYVHPSASTTRPKINRALIQALWWFRAACLEQSQLMAIVKYTACLDALADGKQDSGIRQLIEARLGISPNDNLTNNKTAKEVVDEMYKARSRTIHGTNQSFGHDWSGTRELAESVAAHCFRACCDWIHTNQACDDLVELRR